MNGKSKWKEMDGIRQEYEPLAVIREELAQTTWISSIARRDESRQGVKNGSKKDGKIQNGRSKAPGVQATFDE